MAPPRKPTLPAALLKQLDQQSNSNVGRGKGRFKQQLLRKDQRKARRVQKRQARVAPRQNPPKQEQRKQETRKPETKKSQSRASGDSWGRVLKEDELDDDDFASDLGEDESAPEESDIDEDDDEDEDEETPHLSKYERQKLDRDDAEIATLEKKLGLKGKKKSKALDEDGLGDLLAELDDDDGEDEEVTAKGKRKAEADEWLAQKRRKANTAAAAAASSKDKAASGDSWGHVVKADDLDDESASDLDEEDDSAEEGLADLGDFDRDSDDDNSEGDEESGEDAEFEGFSESEAEEEPAPRKRENPYVAPTTGVAKYVPPSLRKQAQSGDEVDAQLRRRVQGLLNRLTNENLLGIIKDVSGLYDSFPRQSVTATLVDLIITLVCSPEKRPDGFFTMIAGFVAGAQKAFGMHVAANFIQKIAEIFKQYHDRASGDHSDAASKHLIALLAELYNMQVLGSTLIFDYVRLFLANLSELNTELLLRIIQTCGPSLRREDPHALKDIINQVNPASLRNVSVRTSFMMEEMKKLQSNKNKAAARNKDSAEKRTQIRKRISTLNGPSEIQPLRMSLGEIENADKHGKWWVVGASWSGNREKDQKTGTEAEEDNDGFSDLADDDDLDIPDLWTMARTLGFNTDVRQRIFVALHAASDYESAELLIGKLRLNKHQRKEIPEVILRSNEAYEEYNRYYFIVATRFCGDRELAFQFRRSLTTRFKKMGEDIDTGDGDDYDADGDEEYDERQIKHAALFYGSLVARRSLGLNILKYRNLAALREKSQLFVEVLLTMILHECKKDHEKDHLQTIFGSLDFDLARGLQYFLSKHIRKHIKKTDLLKKEERKTVEKQCERAEAILEASLTAVTTW